MPKGGSGFRRGASRSAGNLLKGKSRDWRISDRAAASKYRDEIAKLYESMYRSGMTVQRNNRGNIIGYGGGDDALQRAANRIGELANRIAGSVEMYDATMAREYARLRQTWGKAVRVNAQDMKEFRNQLQSGERMLINPRGGRTASDAEGRLAESGIRSDLVGNANILSDANRQLNAVSNSIWRGVSGEAKRYYAQEIGQSLINRYNRVASEAQRRRKQ